jgi:hypothetical protein
MGKAPPRRAIVILDYQQQAAGNLQRELMHWKTYFLVTGIIFALVALAHALRIYMDWPVVIADWSVPKSVSWIGLIVAGGIALLAFRLFGENENH